MFVAPGAGYASDMSTPAPPGGPQRQDRPQTETQDTSHDEQDSPHGDTIPIEDEQPDPKPAQDGDTLQFENAETSLDQPSEG